MAATGTKKKKKKIKPIAKPYLKGPVFCGLTVQRALKLLCYPLIFMLIHLFIGPVFSFEGSLILRVVMNTLIIVFCIGLMYASGQNTGYADITIAEIMYTHTQEGKPVTDAERERCFHPLRGALTAALSYLPILILAVMYALTAVRQTLTLTALPGWVSGYSYQKEFAAPLQYYMTSDPLTVQQALRIVMRLLIYPYVNLVGARSTDAVLLIDRLAPLTLSLPYIGYAVGYLRGRYSRAMVHGSVAAARRKRGKKVRKPAPRKRKVPEELV